MVERRAAALKFCFLPLRGKKRKVKTRAIRRDFMRCAQPAVRMGQDPSLHYYPKKGFFDGLVRRTAALNFVFCRCAAKNTTLFIIFYLFIFI